MKRSLPSNGRATGRKGLLYQVILRRSSEEALLDAAQRMLKGEVLVGN